MLYFLIWNFQVHQSLWYCGVLKFALGVRIKSNPYFSLSVCAGRLTAPRSSDDPDYPGFYLSSRLSPLTSLPEDLQSEFLKFLIRRYEFLMLNVVERDDLNSITHRVLSLCFLLPQMSVFPPWIELSVNKRPVHAGAGTRCNEMAAHSRQQMFAINNPWLYLSLLWDIWARTGVLKWDNKSEAKHILKAFSW